MHLDHLVGAVAEVDLAEPAREEQVDDLGENAGRAVQMPERIPGGRDQPGLLGELALRGCRRSFAGVQLPGRELPQPTAGDMPVLTQQANPAALIQRHRRGPARVTDHLEVDVTPVRQANALDPHVDDLAVKRRLFRRFGIAIGRFV
jgi:hypothetical protein